MVNVSTVALIVILIIFIILDILIIILIFTERGKFRNCTTNQSSFCPVVTCNSPASEQETTAGQSCFPYGYRYTNSDQTEWVCNYPLAGLTPLS